MRKIAYIAAAVLFAAPAVAQVPPAAQKNVQTIMQGVGSDWQSMETAKNHFIAGLTDLQQYAQRLEMENAQLRKELDELKKPKGDQKK
jgi:cell shape-determining protein MreC